MHLPPRGNLSFRTETQFCYYMPQTEELKVRRNLEKKWTMVHSDGDVTFCVWVTLDVQ